MGGNPIAASIFAAFVAVTLGITYWANRRSTGAKDFYAAGGRITARQNGLAMAGDYLSAASFLGTISIFFSVGTDGLLYAVGAVAGWPIATLSRRRAAAQSGPLHVFRCARLSSC